MARDLKIDARFEAVPSPQWVKDRDLAGLRSIERLIQLCG
jgi:hypothetical protein